MRLFVSFTVVALLATAAADAVVRENGPIFFFGSRASDVYSEIYSVAAEVAAA